MDTNEYVRQLIGEHKFTDAAEANNTALTAGEITIVDHRANRVVMWDEMPDEMKPPPEAA